MEDSSFSQHVKDVIAKWAGNVCSNPDCQAITTGPGESESQSISVGDSAHIFGTNSSSARFDPAISPIARSDITNALWLCRSCHKLVADSNRFPPNLLFEWRLNHEKAIAERTGKPGDVARQRLLSREFEHFKDCSYLAQRIVIDKPDYWEHKLTAELLRHKMEDVLSRWRLLSNGLYAQPTTRVSMDEFVHWYKSRLEDLVNVIGAIKGLINSELPASWGPPGEAGSETEILRVCNLLAACCRHLLDWEESVRFASVPYDFEGVKANLIGIGGRQIQKLSTLPGELAKALAEPGRRHEMEIVIDLPEGWQDQALQVMRAALLRQPEIETLPGPVRPKHQPFFKGSAGGWFLVAIVGSLLFVMAVVSSATGRRRHR